ncbi:MAG: excinuclease ABC subunit UvrC [Chlamydiae bacterium]|nr:excinuclease ABC subunit UvrC [Chlamydiota bacterium]
MRFDIKQLENFPTDPGVYLMKNETGKVIYIGKAKVLKVRVKQYFASSGDDRAMIPFLRSELAAIDTIVTRSEKEALLLENTLIKKHKPKYNAILKDDKSYISLMINQKHKWPMLRLIRYKDKPKEQGLYFGPYTSAHAARQTYDLLQNIFPLRQCSDEELKRRSRPCLLYSIKRCAGPCVGLCSEEEYSSYVQGAIKFLRGQDKEILSMLYKQMETASEALEFERAASILKTIRQIEHVTEGNQIVYKATGKDMDSLALYREAHEIILTKLIFKEGKLTGSNHYCFSELAQDDDEIYSTFILQHYKDLTEMPEEILTPIPLKDGSLLEELLSEEKKRKVSIVNPLKGEKLSLIKMTEQNAKATFLQQKDHKELKEKMLLELQEQLQLTRYPKRIECFDTSNISGSDLVACLVAYYEGEKDKKRTRYFHIKGIDKSDDYGAMRQALLRRLTRAKEENDFPDLIIVDGGKGQLSTALDVFKELNIASVDLIALAKEEARHDKGMTLERVFLPHTKEPVRLEPRSPLLFFLQKIRDNAHEKAIEFHRKTRTKRTIKSALEEIPGIGPVKRKKLLSHFGSIKRILAASDEELLSITGISNKDILSIREFQKKETDKQN